MLDYNDSVQETGQEDGLFSNGFSQLLWDWLGQTPQRKLEHFPPSQRCDVSFIPDSSRRRVVLARLLNFSPSRFWRKKFNAILKGTQRFRLRKRRYRECSVWGRVFQFSLCVVSRSAGFEELINHRSEGFLLIVTVAAQSEFAIANTRNRLARQVSCRDNSQTTLICTKLTCLWFFLSIDIAQFTVPFVDLVPIMMKLRCSALLHFRFVIVQPETRLFI